jgi:hypothetical protein
MVRTVQNLKALHDPQVTLICLSDANQVFIDTILKVRAPPPLQPRMATQSAARAPIGQGAGQRIQHRRHQSRRVARGRPARRAPAR